MHPKNANDSLVKCAGWRVTQSASLMAIPQTIHAHAGLVVGSSFDGDM